MCGKQKYCFGLLLLVLNLTPRVLFVDARTVSYWSARDIWSAIDNPRQSFLCRPINKCMSYLYRYSHKRERVCGYKNPDALLDRSGEVTLSAVSARMGASTPPCLEKD